MALIDEVLPGLVVEPGKKAGLHDRDPGLGRRRPLPPLRQGDAEGQGRRAPRAAPPGAGRRPGAAVRRRPLRPPRGVPGHGRRRQGRHHQARHVRGEPPGRRGPQLQAALHRGARPQLPLALLEGRARARPHRHLQPLLLRGGARPAGAPRVAGAPAAATRQAGGEAVEGALRRHQRLRAPPRPQRDQDREVLPPRVEGGAEAAVPRPPRRRRTRTGSSPSPTSPSGPTGTTTSGPTRTPSPPPPRSGRRGTSSPPTGSG